MLPPLGIVLGAILALAGIGCGRDGGIADKQLGGLVIAPKEATQDKIELSRAVRDPAELGRALASPVHRVVGALGVHTLAVNTTSTVSEGGADVSQLTDHVTLELGDKGAFHATYANSADYGREVKFVGGTLYLRPSYQRWHQRAPEAPEEPGQIIDSFGEAVGATWDLLAPGAELSDLGTAQVAGRTGKKIAVKLAPSPRANPKEPLAQRAWRQQRTIQAVAGEVVLDAESGVPLAVKLSGTISFMRDGRRFTMKVAVDSVVSAIGQAVAVETPAADSVVATPERLREVDDRDFLLQGIAPPLRKNPDGTPVPPAAGSNSK